MSRLLRVYMLQQFVQMAVVASLGLAFLFLVFDILARSDDVIRGGMPVFEAIGQYAAWRLPQLISLIIPMAGLLAAMAVYNKLHSQHEIGAMQSSGIRILRILWVFMLGGFFIASLHFIFLNSLVLGATENLRLWEENDFEPVTEQTNITRYPAWFMVGDYMLYAEGANKQNNKLYQVKLIERDEQGLMERYIVADNATYEDAPEASGMTGKAWVLRDGEMRVLGSGDSMEFDIHPTHLDTTPKELAVFDKKLDEMTLRELKLLSEASNINNDRGHYYKTWLHRRFSQPIGTMVMVLIAAPILFMRPRGANRIIAGFTIILFGFLFFVAERIALSGAESGNFPTAFTVWLPTYLFGGGVIAYCMWRESRFSRK